MERRKLPNATAVLILGILSIVTCCCYGVPGLIFGGIALYLYAKDMKEYREEPEAYVNYGNLNIGRILAIIGLALSALWLITVIVANMMYTEEEMESFLENLRAKQEQMESVD